MVERSSYHSSFKVVGLIASIIVVLAAVIGTVTWITTNLASNTITTNALKDISFRHETLISKNSEIIGQHSQLLAILNQHGKTIEILTDFMTEGGRFTVEDGQELKAHVYTLEERVRGLNILAPELKWIKQSVADIEIDIKIEFEKIRIHLEKITESQVKAHQHSLENRP